MQREAERLARADLARLVEGVYREKRALWRRHVAGAERVGSYEFNNTYQYVIAREETHLAWLRAALRDVGAEPSESEPVPLPADGGQGEQAIIADDARTAAAFVERWRDRVDAVSHGRHRRLLRLVLGETLEHQRFFAQAEAGRADLLGRRPAGIGTGGGVLPGRWVE